jgi:hypothetical protein
MHVNIYSCIVQCINVNIVHEGRISSRRDTFLASHPRGRTSPRRSYGTFRLRDRSNTIRSRARVFSMSAFTLFDRRLRSDRSVTIATIAAPVSLRPRSRTLLDFWSVSAIAAALQPIREEVDRDEYQPP